MVSDELSLNHFSLIGNIPQFSRTATDGSVVWAELTVACTADDCSSALSGGSTNFQLVAYLDQDLEHDGSEEELGEVRMFRTVGDLITDQTADNLDLT